MPKFEIFYGNSYKEALGNPGVLVTYEQYLGYLECYSFVIVAQDDEEIFDEAQYEYHLAHGNDNEEEEED